MTPDFCGILKPKRRQLHTTTVPSIFDFFLSLFPVFESGCTFYNAGVFQSLLYRCPEGYLFNSSSLRCKKETEVTCIESPETRAVQIIQLTEDMLDTFFSRWGNLERRG